MATTPATKNASPRLSVLPLLWQAALALVLGIFIGAVAERSGQDPLVELLQRSRLASQSVLAQVSELQARASCTGRVGAQTGVINSLGAEAAQTVVAEVAADKAPSAAADALPTKAGVEAYEKGQRAVRDAISTTMKNDGEGRRDDQEQRWMALMVRR